MIPTFYRYKLYNTTGVTIPANAFVLKIGFRALQMGPDVSQCYIFKNTADLLNNNSVVLDVTAPSNPISGPFLDCWGTCEFNVPSSVTGAFMLYFEFSPDNQSWPTLGRGKMVLSDQPAASGATVYTINYFTT